MKGLFIGLLILSTGWAVAQTPSGGVGRNDAVDDLTGFEGALARKLGEYYYKGRAGRTISQAEKDSVRRELTLLRQSLTNYYVLTGRFPSILLPKTALDDTSRLKVATEITPRPAIPPDNRLGLRPTSAGWVFTKRGNCQPQNDTIRTYALSADSTLIALSMPTRLTIRRVATGCPVGQPLVGLSQPTYAFASPSKDLFVVDQLNPAVLKRIDADGKVSSINLPDSLARLGYRIDQIRPDDSLIVARRIQQGRTVISVWHYGWQQRQALFSLNYPAQVTRLERLSTGPWLLAVYQPEVQSYQLFVNRTNGGGAYQSLLQRVREHRTDERGNLVALRADSSLVAMNLTVPSPTPTTIATHARYFDWQAGTLVYWKQRDPKAADQWGLYVQNPFGGNPAPARPAQARFWYNTDLRRDVPRLSLRGRDVYFEDRSNHTLNRVALE